MQPSTGRNDLDDALFGQIVQRLVQLLGSHRIFQHDTAQHLRREIRNAGELQRLAFGQAVADVQCRRGWECR